MATNETIIEEEDKLKYKLENFEGPLDLLLYLIRGSKLDIREVKLAEITEQYLRYIEGIADLKIEKASEFLEVAATLIEIKSKSLLPRPEVILNTNEEDCEEMLLRRLEEYRLFKEASEELKKQENVDRFYKEPEKCANDYRIVLKDFSFDKLIDAFAKMLHKTEIKTEVILPREIRKDRFTLTEKVASIVDTLQSRKKIMFFSLFDDEFSRSEIITTFMAVLELLKREQIYVKQEEHYGDIEILKNEKTFCGTAQEVMFSEIREEYDDGKE